MKKVSSNLLMCAFVFSIVIIFSGTASALMIVGDPYPGNSWHQKFRISNVGNVDRFDVYMGSGGAFKNWDYFSDSSWHTDYFSPDHLSCSGNSITDMIFEGIFESIIPGDWSKPLSFNFISWNGNNIKEWLKLSWDGFHWHCEDHSIPDAGIMWLLGPAFIALGILGRKKSRISLKTSHQT